LGLVFTSGARDQLVGGIIPSMLRHFSANAMATEPGSASAVGAAITSRARPLQRARERRKIGACPACRVLRELTTDP
jgi:hypothetical protein